MAQSPHYGAKTADICKSGHIRKPLYCFCEIFNRLVRVAMLNSITDAVFDMSLQNHLTAAMQRGLGCINLGQDIFTGNILIDHAVNRLHLTDDFL